MSLIAVPAVRSGLYSPLEQLRGQFSVRVTGDGRWGSKVDAALSDLLSLLRSPECEGEKAIVFSQWPEVRQRNLI